MPDPIEELSGFDPGVPVNPIPPAEVRRRGERLRRRNLALVGGAVAAVLLVAVPIAVFAGGDKDGQPRPADRLTTDALLAADEVPAQARLTDWRETPSDGEVLACAPQQNSLSDDADDSVRRDFGADLAGLPAGDGPTSVVKTSVLQFSDDEAARGAYDRVQGWIFGCPGGEDLAGKGVSMTTVDIEDGRGEWRRHDFYAPDICTECDAIRFNRMGVAQFGDRVVLVSLAEVGGPLQPKGLDKSMDALFEAAVAKAGGRVIGAEEPPAPRSLEDFPLAAGMPDESDNSDYRFDPPSGDVEGMISAGELTACGNSPPETVPTERLTTRLRGPADSQIRELQLLPDEQEAVTYVAHLRNLYQSCPTSDSDGGPPTFTTTVAEGSFGEESLDIRSASDGIGRVAVTVVRIGNAVLVENVSDEGVGSEVDALATAAHENLADVIAAMNERWGDPGDDPVDPGATPLSPAGASIPDGFPLAAGWPDQWEPGGDNGLTGPSPTLREFGYDSCEDGADTTLSMPTADRLRAGWQNVEDFRTRELLVFADADAAVSFLDQASGFYGACPRQEQGDGYTRVTEVRETQVGGQSFAAVRTWEFDGAPAVGMETMHFVRLGRAVLIDTASNEGGAGPDLERDIERQLQEQTDGAAPVVAAMCEFTEAGC